MDTRKVETRTKFIFIDFKMAINQELKKLNSLRVPGVKKLSNLGVLEKQVHEEFEIIRGNFQGSKLLRLC